MKLSATKNTKSAILKENLEDDEINMVLKFMAV